MAGPKIKQELAEIGSEQNVQHSVSLCLSPLLAELQEWSEIRKVGHEKPPSNQPQYS